MPRLNMLLVLAFLVGFVLSNVLSQTRVDIPTQTSNGTVIVPGPGIFSVTNPTTREQTIETDPQITPRFFTGSGAPASTCAIGRDFYTDVDGRHLYFCSATNTWTQVI